MSSVATVTITLKNTQSTATPANFQAQLNINFSVFSQLDADLGNIRFSTDFAGTSLLYAWLESAPQGTFTKGTSISAYTSSYVWVNLGSNTVPANGSLTIYMQILSSGTEFDGVYWGANPQWTSTYGQYDNGAKVFNNYWNFAGTSLPSGWQEPQTAGITINNGVSFAPGSAVGYIETTAKYPIGAFTEANFNVSTIGAGGIALSVDINGNAYTDDYWIYIENATGEAYNGIVADTRSTYSASFLSGAITETNGFGTSGSFIGSITATSTEFYIYKNYNTLIGDTTTDIPPQGNYYIFIGSGGAVFSINWLRARAYPPNGTNLTVTVGLPVAFVPIKLTNSQSSATPSGFQAQLNINFSGYSQLDTDLGNIRFSTDSAGNNLLYAWLESAPQGSFEKGTSISSYTSSTVWINLGSNIVPANGSLTIYMQILSSGTEFDGVYWGANPLWTSTYGQYDNGAKVFNNYWNFAGTSLPSGFINNGVTISQDNGITITPSGTAGTWSRNSLTYSSINFYGSNYVAEGFSNVVSISSGDITPVFIINSNSTTAYSGTYNLVASGIDDSVSSYFSAIQNPSGTTTMYSLTMPSGFNRSNFNIYQIFVSGATVGTTVNYNSILNTETDYNPSTQYLAIGLWGSCSITTYWLRVRAYPPNGTNLNVEFYETLNDSYSLIESNVIKKTNLGKNDNYSLIENIAKLTGEKLSDSLSFTDLQLLKDIKLELSEIFSIVEAIKKTIAINETDSYIFSELIQFLDEIFIAENYSVIDLGVSKKVSFSEGDILTLVDDILSKRVSFEEQDVYTPAEVMVKRWITSLIDNYSVNDKGVIKNIIQNLVDGYEILETIFKKYSTSKSDSFTPADLGLVISWLFYVNLADSFSIIDIPSIKSVNKKLIDTLILADMAVSFYIKLNKSDTYNLSEILNKQVSFTKTDSYTFSEIMRLLGMIAISENFILEDLGINRNVFISKLDDYSLIEFVNKFMKLHQSDEYGLNESLVKMAVKIFFDEQAAMAESIKRNIFSNKKDIMSIVEMLEKDTSKRFSDNITLSETYSITLGSWDIMSLIASFFTTAGIKPVTLYDIKYYDVLRGGNSAIIYKGTSNELYVGFGREMYTDLEIVADAWIFGDNETLDALISSIHQQVEVWQPISPQNQVFNDVIVWVKLLSEQNLQSRVRGVTLYRFNFQVRLYRRQQ
ncbi:MAG: hypothetical protein QXU98_05495 [Candidatus Parvarchaeota archaeon]